MNFCSCLSFLLSLQCLGLLSRFGGSEELRQFKFQDDNVEGDRVSRKDEVELQQQVRGGQSCSYSLRLLMLSGNI